MPMAIPPPKAIEAFVGGPAVRRRLPGGQGTAWLVGNIVLKPLDMPPGHLEWQARVLGGLDDDGFRVAVPLRSAAGQLIVDGWTAWPWLEGRHLRRWPEILSVGEALHNALANVPRPRVLDERQDRWIHADKIAWGEAPAPLEIETISDIEWLLKSRRTVSSTSQLIHGDLSGNVLFANGQAPAVIDFSPYWRPKSYASALVVVDAIARHRAGVDMLDSVLREPDGEQLLIRALLFRQLSDPDPTAGRYSVAIEALRRQRR
jgi:uncharacterized protein (TIGR02569 family)